jgi:predicted membrane chloride channel (bestrophin family)
MPRASDPMFCTLHALRLKGFAKAEVISDVAALPVHTVGEHLRSLAAAGQAQFREARQLWQLTPLGRERHREALAADTPHEQAGALHEPYEQFLTLNEHFKHLCSEWQLRDGQPNDHADARYDADLLERLSTHHEAAVPLVAEMGERIERLGAYGRRLDAARQRVASGETNMFTGVMCESYHDVWMELHEDLILTQGIDRVAEGSF